MLQRVAHFISSNQLLCSRLGCRFPRATGCSRLALPNRLVGTCGLARPRWHSASQQLVGSSTLLLCSFVGLGQPTSLERLYLLLVWVRFGRWVVTRSFYSLWARRFAYASFLFFLGPARRLCLAQWSLVDLVLWWHGALAARSRQLLHCAPCGTELAVSEKLVGPRRP